MKTPCYCTALRAAARRMTAIYDEALAPSGVNTAQFSLLRKVAAAQTITLTELARQSELDRSTVGRNVRVLEQLDLLRAAQGADRREAAISLTDNGRRTLELGTPLWDATQDRVEAALGNSAARELRAMLNNL